HEDHEQVAPPVAGAQVQLFRGVPAAEPQVRRDRIDDDVVPRPDGHLGRGHHLVGAVQGAGQVEADRVGAEDPREDQATEQTTDAVQHQPDRLLCGDGALRCACGDIGYRAAPGQNVRHTDEHEYLEHGEVRGE